MKEALALLRKALGNPAAEFRPGQWEAVATLVESRGRLLVVQRTGWGKSLVYFLATRLLRDRGAGCTLLISPLLSLMRNQILAAERLGIRAATINSSNEDQWPEVESLLCAGMVDVLLISPERLANDEFVAGCLLPIASRIGLLVVDEAHCISDWGHDFRPDYRRIVRVLQALPHGLPVLATTATANDRVIGDIANQLGPRLRVQRGSLARSTLALQNLYLPSAAERMAWLAEQLPQLPGSGIVYTLTVKDTIRLANWLRSRGVDAEAYHAKTENREELEERLLQNDVKVLVATVALGMGFDKPDLGFVVHYQRPASVVHYYQQVGRAGRAVDEAYGILLNGEEDDEIAAYFIRNAFPAPAEITALLAALEAARGPLSILKIQQHVNLAFGKIEKALKFLSLESPSPVQKTPSGYVLNPVPWQMPVERIQRITDLRRAEQERMRVYMQTQTCLMQFLAAELNDREAAPCGRCRNCAGRLLPESVGEGTSAAAVGFLNRLENPIHLRRQWPAGLPDERLRGRIAPQEQGSEGRVLSRWADPGWGRLVQRGKLRAGRFVESLVEASVQMIRERWRPDPPPRWLTFVPSPRHPELVPDFARRLAGGLGLPCSECVIRLRDNEPQKARANSFQRVMNLMGVFAIDAGKLLPGPALLVDDITDSRWTFTLLAVLLRQAGCEMVYPFALADTSSDDGD
jgi:ATP-dependent DNA helicase RecQ